MQNKYKKYNPYDRFEDCEPEIIKVEYEVDYDYEGRQIFEQVFTFSCEECDNKECDYYYEYNKE